MVSECWYKSLLFPSVHVRRKEKQPNNLKVFPIAPLNAIVKAGICRYLTHSPKPLLFHHVFQYPLWNVMMGRGSSHVYLSCLTVWHLYRWSERNLWTAMVSEGITRRFSSFVPYVKLNSFGCISPICQSLIYSTYLCVLFGKLGEKKRYLNVLVISAAILSNPHFSSSEAALWSTNHISFFYRAEEIIETA